MLIPALVKHLPNSILRSQVVSALKWFDPAALWATLSQYIESAVRQPESTLAHLSKNSVEQRREALSGALKVLEMSNFPLEDKLGLLLSLIDTLIVSPMVPMDDSSDRSVEETVNVDILHHLFGRDAVLEELVVDSLLTLVRTSKAVLSLPQVY